MWGPQVGSQAPCQAPARPPPAGRWAGRTDVNSLVCHNPCGNTLPTTAEIDPAPEPGAHPPSTFLPAVRQPAGAAPCRLPGGAAGRACPAHRTAPPGLQHGQVEVGDSDAIAGAGACVCFRGQTLQAKRTAMSGAQHTTHRLGCGAAAASQHPPRCDAGRAAAGCSLCSAGGLCAMLELSLPATL